jgi:hypothetical protein
VAFGFGGRIGESVIRCSSAIKRWVTPSLLTRPTSYVHAANRRAQLTKTIAIAPIREPNCVRIESEAQVDQWEAMTTRAVDIWTAKYLTSRRASLSRLEGALSPPDEVRIRRIASLRQAIAEVERHRVVFVSRAS